MLPESTLPALAEFALRTQKTTIPKKMLHLARRQLRIGCRPRLLGQCAHALRWITTRTSGRLPALVHKWYPGRVQTVVSRQHFDALAGAIAAMRHQLSLDAVIAELLQHEFHHEVEKLSFGQRLPLAFALMKSKVWAIADVEKVAETLQLDAGTCMPLWYRAVGNIVGYNLIWSGNTDDDGLPTHNDVQSALSTIKRAVNVCVTTLSAQNPSTPHLPVALLNPLAFHHIIPGRRDYIDSLLQVHTVQAVDATHASILRSNSYDEAIDIAATAITTRPQDAPKLLEAILEMSYPDRTTPTHAALMRLSHFNLLRQDSDYHLNMFLFRAYRGLRCAMTPLYGCVDRPRNLDLRTYRSHAADTIAEYARRWESQHPFGIHTGATLSSMYGRSGRTEDKVRVDKDLEAKIGTEGQMPRWMGKRQERVQRLQPIS